MVTSTVSIVEWHTVYLYGFNAGINSMQSSRFNMKTNTLLYTYVNGNAHCPVYEDLNCRNTDLTK